MGKMKSNNKNNVIFVISAFELLILARWSMIFAYTQIFMLLLFRQPNIKSILSAPPPCAYSKVLKILVLYADA
jgi:hypothetical protein